MRSYIKKKKKEGRRRIGNNRLREGSGAGKRKRKGGRTKKEHCTTWREVGRVQLPKVGDVTKEEG